MDFDQATRSRLAQQAKSQNAAILKALEENTNVLKELVRRVAALEAKKSKKSED